MDIRPKMVRMALGVAMLTLVMGAIIFGIVQHFHRNNYPVGYEVLSLGGSTFSCSAHIDYYDRALWKDLSIGAARRGATWHAFGIRDGKVLAIVFESERAEWHFYFCIPVPR